ncbi:MAG: NAD(P)H-hydrate epimerase [Phycisphaerae bacterium]
MVAVDVPLSPHSLHSPLTCKQVRSIDVLAIARLGLPGIVLMENAGRNATELILGWTARRDRAAGEIVILCGPGNNGGDGFVIARHLHNSGRSVRVVLSIPAARSKDDAATNLRVIEHMKLPIIDASTAGGLETALPAIRGAGVIVDALLGNGSTGPPRGVLGDLIRVANGCASALRVAVDIPSGLDADTGVVGEPCFAAHETITFVAPKVGFAQETAANVLGRVSVAGIGTPPSLIALAMENNQHANGESNGSRRELQTEPRS